MITAVEDGAYLIDLTQARSMRDVYKAIIKRLRIPGMEPERSFILESASLKNMKCVLVFEGLDEGKDL